MRRGPVGPLISLLTIIVTALLLGNLFLTVDAHGRVMDDWNNTPIKGAQILFGSRTAIADDDGNFVMQNVPRGASLNVRATTYASADVPAGDVGEVRLRPATLNITVLDSATGLGVKNPEAHKGDQTLRVGTETGDIAIAHPGKDETFLVCAAKYTSKEVHTTLTRLEVKLDPNVAGACPTPPPTPTPSPTETPSGSPSPTPSAAPSAAPSPSPSRSP
jgi:hypothetical protein